MKMGIAGRGPPRALARLRPSVPRDKREGWAEVSMLLFPCHYAKIYAANYALFFVSLCRQLCSQSCENGEMRANAKISSETSRIKLFILRTTWSSSAYCIMHCTLYTRGVSCVRRDAGLLDRATDTAYACGVLRLHDASGVTADRTYYNFKWCARSFIHAVHEA